MTSISYLPTSPILSSAVYLIFRYYFFHFSCHAVIFACNGLKTRMMADDRKAGW